MTAAVLMLRNNRPVADSIFLILAAEDRHRSNLYSRLKKAGKLDLFPAKYKNQQDIARSFLFVDKYYEKIDSIAFVKKMPASYLDKKGVVYCYKYRVKKEDDWKMGLSGLQPADEKLIDTEDKLTTMTEKKIKANESLDDQFENQLKRTIFSFYKSGRNFYSNNSLGSYRSISTYQD